MPTHEGHHAAPPMHHRIRTAVGPQVHPTGGQLHVMYDVGIDESRRRTMWSSILRSSHRGGDVRLGSMTAWWAGEALGSWRWCHARGGHRHVLVGLWRSMATLLSTVPVGGDGPGLVVVGLGCRRWPRRHLGHLRCPQLLRRRPRCRRRQHRRRRPHRSLAPSVPTAIPRGRSLAGEADPEEWRTSRPTAPCGSR